MLGRRAPTTAAAQSSPAPSSIVLYFDSGSAVVRRQDVALLDQASGLYREGKPIVMVVTGGTDNAGSAAANPLSRNGVPRPS